MRLLYLFIISTLFLSCSDFKKKDQIKRIDGLITTIDSILIVKTENEIEGLEEIVQNIEKTKEILIDRNDTITYSQGLLVDQLKTTSSQISPYLSYNSFIDTNALSIKVALEGLKSDIEGANGKRHEYDNYITHESDKVDSLRSTLEQLILVKSSIIEGDNVYYPVLFNELKRLPSEEGMTFDN